MNKVNPNREYTHLHIRMATADYLELKAQAAENQTSISAFILSKLNLAQQVPSKLDLEVFKDLFKCRNDLARLGNLFKLAIDQQTYDEDELLKLFDVISDTNQQMRSLIADCQQKVAGGGA